MDNLPLAEYGVAVVAIGALGFIVVKFLGHLKEKDDKFVNVISNHIDHATEANTRLAVSIDRNTEATAKLTEKVDRKL